ncbi:hypothetical protein [Bradyrhizobium sp. Tv2a-2]|uniref:hypothetical protein n=1 Tax=Bradyrhizobium sp. Tv2a-2 TaxID=113395 RepID=UPI00041EEA83|nr:hypothetical protein [Bradyrhizobium sp. Tv2a-2]
MPTNTMNIGVDYSFSYFDGASGILLDISDIEDVTITAMKHDIKAMPYNNLPRYDYVDDGFRIEFSIVRTSATLENYMITRSQQLLNGTVRQPGFLNQAIINPDGSTSRYQYVNCVIFLTDHGNISRDKPVKLKLEGMASAKTQIA